MEAFYLLCYVGAFIIGILILISPLIIIGRLGKIIKLLDVIAKNDAGRTH